MGVTPPFQELAEAASSTQNGYHGFREACSQTQGMHHVVMSGGLFPHTGVSWGKAWGPV